MRIITADVARTAIDAEIAAARYPGHDPARWALPLIATLDRDAAGWQLVQLEHDDLASLWMPAHAGEPCHGDRMTLGHADGSPLSHAGAWLDVNQTAYAEANPSCWGRIAYAGGAPRAPLVVSPVAVGDRRKPAGASLVVVDGLHRALAYWLAGDRVCHAYLPRIS